LSLLHLNTTKEPKSNAPHNKGLILKIDTITNKIYIILQI